MSNSKITILGTVTRDPVFKPTANGGFLPVAVAVNTSSKDKTGNYITNFYDVAIWGKLGERLANKLQKGSKVLVTGDFAIESYVDKNGSERLTNKISAYDATGIANLKDGSQQAIPPTKKFTEVEDTSMPF